MSFRPGVRPHPSPVLASAVVAAGLMLTVAGCGHLTPLGPTPPQPRRLGAPIVLRAMRVEPATPDGGCPSGFTAVAASVSGPATGPGTGPVAGGGGGGGGGSGGGSVCGRTVGSPVTIAIAAVSPLPPHQPPPTAGQHPAPALYPLAIALPAAEAASLTAVTTTAFDHHGFLDITVAGHTWLLPKVLQPLTHGQFVIALPSWRQAAQLHRKLTA